MNSRNIIARNPSTVIPLLTNQDLTPMLLLPRLYKEAQVLLTTQFTFDDFLRTSTEVTVGENIGIEAVELDILFLRIKLMRTHFF